MLASDDNNEEINKMGIFRILVFISMFLNGILGELYPRTESNIVIEKQWNLINFNLPWDYPNSKEFNNPETVVITGFEVDSDRFFLSAPRLFSGVPATLNTVPKGIKGDSPVLEPYPDWSFHAAGRKAYNCSDLGLVSVYRVRIDSCNRLWALDSGISRSLEDFEKTCPPKILVFDLNTDSIVRRIDFPSEVVRGETLFTNLVIDETTANPANNCDDVFVYITDTVEPAIVVYDSGRDLTWRLSHPSMYPDPDFAQSTILEDRFTLMDGIVGFAFDAKQGLVYFQPFAVDRVFSVSINALRAGPLPFNTELPVRLVGKKSSQGIGLEVNPSDGTIYFSPVSETAIAEWNPQTNKQKVLAFDQEQLQFVADLRITKREPGTLFGISSKFHRFYLKTLNTHEVNTRLIRIDNVVNSNYYPSKRPYQPVRGSGHRGPVLTSSPRPSGFFSQYFNSIRTPYPYQLNGISKTRPENPFTALNLGERPEEFGKPQFGLIGDSNFYSKLNPQFQDFNGLRFAKSANGTGNHY